MPTIRKAVSVLAGGALLLGLVPGAVAAPIVFPFGGQFQAGSAPTTFTLFGFSVNVPQMDGAAVRLAAEVTLTDSNDDGATLTGQLPAGNAIELYFDGNSLGGIIAQVIAPPGGMTVSGEAFPPGGYEPLPYTPTWLSVPMKFTLSAYDSAVIAGTLTVVPEPTGALPLAILGLVATRFRR